jgi:hypothetical protein
VTEPRAVPGQPLRLSASGHNQLLALVDAWTKGELGRGGRAPQPPRAGTVLVRNDTGADRDLFEIVALSEPIFGPDDNLSEFQFRFAFKGVVPDLDHFGCFAVLQEPVAAGKIGRAMVEGLTPVQIRTEAGEEQIAFAGICGVPGGECQFLRSSWRGDAQILYRKSGVGLQWGIVRLGARPSLGFGAVVELYAEDHSVYTTYGESNPPQFARYAKIHPCADILGNDIQAAYLYVEFEDYGQEPTAQTQPYATGVTGSPPYTHVAFDTRFARAGGPGGQIAGRVVNRMSDSLPCVFNMISGENQTDAAYFGNVGRLHLLGGGITVQFTGGRMGVDWTGRTVYLAEMTTATLTGKVTIGGVEAEVFFTLTPDPWP